MHGGDAILDEVVEKTKIGSHKVNFHTQMSYEN